MLPLNVMLSRLLLHSIKKRLFKGKAIILIGARQVGKTTLLNQIVRDYGQEKTLFLNCDEPGTLQTLENTTSSQLKGVSLCRK